MWVEVCFISFLFDIHLKNKNHGNPENETGVPSMCLFCPLAIYMFKTRPVVFVI